MTIARASDASGAEDGPLANRPTLFGYASRFSVAAGKSLAFHVSTNVTTFDVDVVRIWNADPNPAGPGMRLEAVADIAMPGVKGEEFPSLTGSRVLVEKPVSMSPADGLMLGMLIWPTKLGDEPCWLLELGSSAGHLAVGATRDGLVVDVAHGNRRSRAVLTMALALRRWAKIEVCLDLVSGTAALDFSEQKVTVDGLMGFTPDFGQITIAGGSDGNSFNGKIEAPFIKRRLGGAWQVVASWDFSKGISGDVAFDTGPDGLHGRIVNGPLRAVTGSAWAGKEMCWTHMPGHYAAIWFHDDDLADCCWPEAFHLALPSDLPPGLYGARLRTGDQEDIVPFVVRSATGATKPRIVFLMPTFTYMAYANVSFGHSSKPDYRARRDERGAYPHHADDYPAFGRSLYDRHSDGSGVAISTRLRPILNFRPGALHVFDPIGSGVRHFVADTHLIDWLDRHGFECEILTDEDLDDEGVSALQDHDILLTGTHPEYHTAVTLDALKAFQDRGGRIAYLGGNGFYWRIARQRDRPHIIELRRAEGGVRAWETEPGESYHAADGTYGGLWRRNGRPPQCLVCVGFTALGGYEAKPYRRSPASFDARYAWVFDGVDDEVIGDFGLVCGGAAGYEIDRADDTLGTPDGTVILASSKDERYDTFSPSLEDLLAPGLSRHYGAPDALIRADMTYWEGPKQSAVFAVGSVTFCGSLSHDNFRNGVSRILLNIIDRWL